MKETRYDIPSAIIEWSFKKYSTNNEMDGSEDYHIYEQEKNERKKNTFSLMFFDVEPWSSSFSKHLLLDELWRSFRPTRPVFCIWFLFFSSKQCLTTLRHSLHQYNLKNELSQWYASRNASRQHFSLKNYHRKQMTFTCNCSQNNRKSCYFMNCCSYANSFDHLLFNCPTA